jgi:hypothetical protein
MIFPAAARLSLDVGNDIVDMLNADGKPHVNVGYADGILRL